MRWGVLGVAGIATKKVIPGMKQCQRCEVVAIASRDAARAAEAASRLGLERSYGSYDELLADPTLDVIYNPLPNHLHVPWSKRVLEAGKAVLCEKPLALSLAEIESLMEVRDRAGRAAGEAFMVKTHPQWVRARRAIADGEIGALRSVTGWFSYDNRDPQNVRNNSAYGGGGLMDIGCYPIFLSRFLFGGEPRRVCGVMDLDPEFGVDRLTSALLEFDGGQAQFVCATQMAPSQRMVATGTAGRLEVEIPFNAPPDVPSRIWINDRAESFEICDQYAIQGDAFARAVVGEAPVPVPLEDSWRTMAVIEAIVESARRGAWVDVPQSPF